MADETWDFVLDSIGNKELIDGDTSSSSSSEEGDKTIS